MRQFRDMAYINDVAWGVVAYNSAFSRMFRRREVPENMWIKCPETGNEISTGIGCAMPSCTLWWRQVPSRPMG